MSVQRYNKKSTKRSFQPSNAPSHPVLYPGFGQTGVTQRFDACRHIGIRHPAVMSIHTIAIVSIYTIAIVSIHTIAIVSIHTIAIVSVHTIAIVSVHTIAIVSVHTIAIVSVHTIAIVSVHTIAMVRMKVWLGYCFACPVCVPGRYPGETVP